MNSPSLLKHLRDILILPFTVTIIIPYIIGIRDRGFIPNHFLTTILGVAILSTGLMLFIYTVALFRSIGKGTLAPWSPTQKLIVIGPYRYCRNPMISAVFFILIGESLILHAIGILIWAGIFFIINTTYFILKEEPDLLKRFGEDYRLYKNKVPRWIPKLKPYSPSDTR
jgi:protein-S-isoprenylcysteine O-methyltransferase Ste14